MTCRYLLVDESGRALVTNIAPCALPASTPRVSLTEVVAYQVPAAWLGNYGAPRPIRELPTDPELIRAAALLYHRARFRFDPADGSPLTYDPAGVVAQGSSGELIYPRIDPAVIGAVILSGSGKLLLAENIHRPGRLTLVAGYVEAGESLEDAFTREVREETGRQLCAVHYWGSQPWPASGSLMMGFTALTRDAEPRSTPDGELRGMRWVAPAEIAGLPLPPVGSIARRLIEAFAAGQLTFPEPES